MEEDFYISYFQNIATKLKALSHLEGEFTEAFFVIEDLDNTDELNEALKRRAKPEGTIMLLELFEDGLTDNDTDNNQAMIFGAFAIVERRNVKSAGASVRTLHQNGRSVGRKINHKMKMDTLNGPLQQLGIICKLDAKGFPVGPVGGMFYGWRYSFTWRAPEPIKLNPEDWHP